MGSSFDSIYPSLGRALKIIAQIRPKIGLGYQSVQVGSLLFTHPTIPFVSQNIPQMPR